MYFSLTRYTFNVGLFSINADTTVGAKHRVLWITMIYLIVNIFTSLSLIIIGEIIESAGFVTPIIMIAVCMILSAASAIFFLPETFPEPAKKIWSVFHNVRKLFGLYLRHRQEVSEMSLLS